MTSLEGKRILFVDDRFEIASQYISRVRREGAEVSYQSKLLGAFNALETDHGFDLAIVDLHMPLPEGPWPTFCKSSIEALANSESDTVRSHNLGQMIGHYITHSLKGKPPYIYLSAVAAYFDPRVDPQMPKGTRCLERYATTSTDLVGVVEKMLGT